MTESLQKALDFVNSDKTQSFIERIINYHGSDFKLSTAEIATLTNIIQAANEVYNTSGVESKLSDITYDALHEMLELATDGVVNTTARNYGATVVYHKYPSLRGTLDKIYYLSEGMKDSNNVNRRGLPEWIGTTERTLEAYYGHKVDLMNEDVYVFPKWDGVSAVFEFNPDGSLDRVLTRGYTVTNEAQDITHIFAGLGIVSQPTGRPHAIKTEIMMNEDDLDTYNSIYGTTYKNSRSIVASIINSKEADIRVRYLKIMLLRTSEMIDGVEGPQMLAEAAFDFPHIKCKLGDVDKILKFALAHKYTDGKRCDGAVIYLINPEYQKILGRKDEKQKFEVAFKFTEETAYSEVKDIEFRVGLLGRIAPVLKIKPVKMKGNTITGVSLGSMARFRTMKLAVGDTVKVLYDIIPYALYDENDPKCKRSYERAIKEPLNCPVCGHPLVTREASDGEGILCCENKKCPCRIKGRILNYLEKMNIEGISYATVDTLYDEGLLKSIADLYSLKKHKKKIKSISGFGDQSVKMMLESIDSHREVTESQMLGSLGIDGIGRRMFEKVLSMLAYDEVLDLCFTETIGKAVNTFSAIPGIGQKMATRIYYGIRENESLIRKLEDELFLIKVRTLEPMFNVVFTKVRDKDLEQFIADKGGVVADNITAKTDVVVVPDMNTTSSKVTKAKKKNIPVVLIDDLKDFILNNLL